MEIKQTKKQLFWEIFRYLLVGGIATVFDYLAWYIFFYLDITDFACRRNGIDGSSGSNGLFSGAFNELDIIANVRF